jgi:hypothetical protein
VPPGVDHDAELGKVRSAGRGQVGLEAGDVRREELDDCAAAFVQTRLGSRNRAWPSVGETVRMAQADWRPLGTEGDQAATYDALHDGVPTWMAYSPFGIDQAPLCRRAQSGPPM